MSTHKIEVIRVGESRPAENSDQLELIQCFGWQCCIKKGSMPPGTLAAFIPPDYTVPTDKPEFAFLKPRAKSDGRALIRAIRLRGNMSFGLVIPAPEGAKEGDDVMSMLGVERWEPPMDVRMGGMHAQRPEGDAPKFDLENLERFSSAFAIGEEVIATEKVHGCNARYLFDGEKMHCGSRTGWYEVGSGDVWTETLALYPQIEAWCRASPDTVLYGEIYGTTQDLRYGSPGRHRFVSFAALDRKEGKWWNFDDLNHQCLIHEVPIVPVVYRGPFDMKALREIAEQDSKVSIVPQLSEGVVVVPVKERIHPEIGRASLKLVSFRYLTR